MPGFPFLYIKAATRAFLVISQSVIFLVKSSLNSCSGSLRLMIDSVIWFYWSVSIIFKIIVEQYKVMCLTFIYFFSFLYQYFLHLIFPADQRMGKSKGYKWFEDWNIELVFSLFAGYLPFSGDFLIKKNSFVVHFSLKVSVTIFFVHVALKKNQICSFTILQNLKFSSTTPTLDGPSLKMYIDWIS